MIDMQDGYLKPLVSSVLLQANLLQLSIPTAASPPTAKSLFDTFLGAVRGAVSDILAACVCSEKTLIFVLFNPPFLSGVCQVCYTQCLLHDCTSVLNYCLTMGGECWGTD